MIGEIHPIRAFSDNYIWIFEGKDKSACVVDPGDAQPVIAYLEENALRLTHILVTHHHPDHTGGVGQLSQLFDPLVYGPGQSPFKGTTHPLRDGDKISVLGVEFDILEVPGHTLDHIAYFARRGDVDERPLVFCGDTLFAGGCGRIFEGNPDMMYRSLMRLAALPAQTRVYCTHEYTISNLRFAAAADAGNKLLAERAKAAGALREKDSPTVPSTIQLELQTNPFLRCEKAELASAAAQHAGSAPGGPAAVFAALRKWKDNF